MISTFFNVAIEGIQELLLIGVGLWGRLKNNPGHLLRRASTEQIYFIEPVKFIMYSMNPNTEIAWFLWWWPIDMNELLWSHFFYALLYIRSIMGIFYLSGAQIDRRSVLTLPISSTLWIETKLNLDTIRFRAWFQVFIFILILVSPWVRLPWPATPKIWPWLTLLSIFCLRAHHAWFRLAKIAQRASTEVSGIIGHLFCFGGVYFI